MFHFWFVISSNLWNLLKVKIYVLFPWRCRDELGKGINTDEAAALGAVYQAAHLGKGFKVKKFVIKEAAVYPIQACFWY